MPRPERPPTRLRPAATVIGVACSIVLTSAACSGSGESGSATPTSAPTSTSAPASTSAPTPSSDAGQPAEAAGAAQLVATPGGEVVCSVSAATARCDVPDSNWPQFPETPADCDSAPFASITLEATGRVQGTCAIGALAGAPGPLADGASVTAGDLTCSNESGTVRCSTAGADGSTTGSFTVDRAGYSTN